VAGLALCAGSLGAPRASVCHAVAPCLAVASCEGGWRRRAMSPPLFPDIETAPRPNKIGSGREARDGGHHESLLGML